VPGCEYLDLSHNLDEPLLLMFWCRAVDGDVFRGRARVSHWKRVVREGDPKRLLVESPEFYYEGAWRKMEQWRSREEWEEQARFRAGVRRPPTPDDPIYPIRMRSLARVSGRRLEVEFDHHDARGRVRFCDEDAGP
jgi:hypothetical protein